MNYVPPRRSDGTIQTRRPQQHWPKDRPFRILSIDGGGICGILPASVLAELEQPEPGERVHCKRNPRLLHQTGRQDLSASDSHPMLRTPTQAGPSLRL